MNGAAFDEVSITRKEGSKKADPSLSLVLQSAAA